MIRPLEMVAQQSSGLLGAMFLDRGFAILISFSVALRSARRVSSSVRWHRLWDSMVSSVASLGIFPALGFEVEYMNRRPFWSEAIAA
jgi:hypothetical protein